MSLKSLKLRIPERINKISGPNDPRYSFPFLFRGKFVVIFRSMIAPLIKRFFDPGINFFSKIRERERVIDPNRQFLGRFLAET